MRGGGGPTRGPPTVVCYVCGREFGRSSIAIHEPQCAKKFEAEQAQKPPGERRPLPTRPEVGPGATREELNEAALHAYEAQVMAHCPGCGRTFKDEATMQRHLKACAGAGRGSPPPRSPQPSRAPEQGGGGPGPSGAAPGGPARPRTVVCFICGREFGVSSIAIHEPQCAKKFEAAEAQKPAHERKPLPQRPDVPEGVSREEYNDAAKDAYEAKVMAHCPGCGRSFKDEATLARHAKACTGKGAAGALQAAPAAEERAREAVAADRGRTGARSPAPPPAAPRTVVCYICGREFGTSSIGIHEPQCAKKFVETEAQKPAHERKPLPQRPDVQEGVTRAEYNDAAKDAYEAKVMAHCPGCGRSFKDEATLARHAKACTGKGAAGALQAAVAADDRAGAREGQAEAAERGGGDARKPAAPRTVVCYICGREFGKSSIGIHEPQCAKKFVETEAQKPAHERKPLPQRPEVQEGVTREEYNDAAKDAYEAKVMAHCLGCGRSFKDEATLARHAKACTGGGARGAPPAPDEPPGARGAGADAAAPGGGGARRQAAPRTVVCYICGREFGTSSIGIHEPQCAQKFLDAEAQKPAHERKPLPQRPQVHEGAAREDYNAAARGAYEADVMVHCPVCGRSFKDEATLARHAKACRGSRAAAASPGPERPAGPPEARGGEDPRASSAREPRPPSGRRASGGVLSGAGRLALG